jgi:putative oxidoreductase
VVWSSLDRYRDAGLLVVRLGFGLGFLWFHGLPKLLGGPERWRGVGDAMNYMGITFGHQWWGLAAAVTESVGGILLALGLLFRPTALALTFVMVVAALNHVVSGQGSAAHAFKNIWLFAGLVLVGAGRYSLDDWLARRAATQRVQRPVANAPVPAGR